MNQMRNAGNTVLYSLTSFFSFLPTLIGALVVLILGWVIAGLIAKLIEKALVAVGFERAVHHSGIGRFIEGSGARWNTSKMLAELAKWFVFLMFVQAAANLLQMPQITGLINSIVLFIPQVVVAVAILVLGSVIAKFLSGVVQRTVAEAGAGNPALLAALANYAVIGFAVVAALNQLGIATTVVNTLFMGLIGSVALAIGLAFGLGGREIAAKITQSWYDSGTEMAEKIQKTTRRGLVEPVGSFTSPEPVAANREV